MGGYLIGCCSYEKEFVDRINDKLSSINKIYNFQSTFINL